MNIFDKVVIKTGLIPEERYGRDIFVDTMEEYCGKTATIIGQTEHGWELDVDDKFWTWTDEMLELIADK